MARTSMMPRTPISQRVGSAFRSIALPCALAGMVACASASANPGGAKYPRRAPGCELAMFGTPVPGVTAWDDIGIAETACHVSTSLAQCMTALKAEACRMGGDILYNIPRHPLRPQDQVMVFRAQVAHSKSGAPKKALDPDMPPPASPAESAGPIVPLTGPAPAATGAGAPKDQPVAPEDDSEGSTKPDSETDTGVDDSSDGP